ncbi:non-ribosomal peptide synthetase [Paenibacillus hexagrammi]|uniref:Amino acid adenylation domain-containing protein n=1 Tax=Paenibacillus hexagrammi TaxID=2908839 RepID=A0ABY3SG38_9BACL|nr:non-ribosomal peptide synthetase [Paenibacillus sp. YPD9-1]UJF32166.1 amino acid adenylation domain-containing protein [Paenibacillus sp. YPD9-1]
MTGEDEIGFLGITEYGESVPIAVSFEKGLTFDRLIDAVKLQLAARNQGALALENEDLIFNCGSVLLEQEKPLLIWQWHHADNFAEIQVNYDESVFLQTTLDRFTAAYLKLLHAALFRSATSIGAVDIMTDDDLRLYKEINHTEADYPKDATFHGMFERSAARFGDRPAVSSQQGCYTYEELNARANRLAHKLLQLGLRKGQFVALYMERSIETVVSLLAVMKAGGAYVPVDPEHPEERVRYILEDTRAPIVLANAESLSKAHALSNSVTTIRDMIAVDSDLEDYPAHNPDVGIAPSELAYVIYTSGSTGKPKGTMLAHEGVVNMGSVIGSEFAMNEYDVLPQYATYSFDASVWDTVAALFHGAHLYLLSREERVSVEAFASAVERTGTTKIAILPTVFFNQLISYLSDSGYRKLEKVQLVMVGGEALNGELVRAFQRRFGKRIDIYNLYGPTECTVVATMHKVVGDVPEQVAQIPIGRPLRNYRVYITNEEGQLCPVNVPGELYIATIGMAKGYLNQPEKTAAAFIDSPFNPGENVYRSGDIVKLLSDGSIEYVGRRDHQVKIRGHRIEIGAIEDAFTQFPDIRDAAVIPRKDEEGHTMLIGFFTSKDGGPIQDGAIKEYLGSKLPSYYVPRWIRQIDVMPLSPTGKVDRKQLATYDYANDSMDPVVDAKPLSETEQKIAQLWKKLLKLGHVAESDDFFELGGDSLNVIQMQVYLKPEYPQLTLGNLFEYTTLTRLAQHLDELQNAEEHSHEAREDEMSIDDRKPHPSSAWDGENFRELIEHPLEFGMESVRKLSYAEPRHVLLTGGTGFLGSRILYDLLRMSRNTVIYALVRGSQPGVGAQRLLEIMHHYFGSEVLELMNDRVIMIEGNLDRDELCERSQDYEMLVQHIDAIIHAAADVRHFGDRRKFERTNIAGTAALLKLAAAKPGVRFHYISTIGIPEELAELGLWDQALQHERIPEELHVKGVYTESKLEAEKMVLAAADEGLAVTIYRPGNLTCDSLTGSFQRNIDGNAFYRMLKAMLLLERAPRARWKVDFTPIDYAGQAITVLALKPDTVGRMFHICNPNPLFYDELLGMINQLGYMVDLVDPADYTSWLLDLHENKHQEGLQLAMAYLEGDGAKDSPYTFDSSQTVAYLKGTGVTCPVIDLAFIRRMFEEAVSQGYFHAVREMLDV